MNNACSWRQANFRTFPSRRRLISHTIDFKSSKFLLCSSYFATSGLPKSNWSTIFALQNQFPRTVHSLYVSFFWRPRWHLPLSLSLIRFAMSFRLQFRLSSFLVLFRLTVFAWLLLVLASPSSTTTPSSSTPLTLRWPRIWVNATVFHGGHECFLFFRQEFFSRPKQDVHSHCRSQHVAAVIKLIQLQIW